MNVNQKLRTSIVLLVIVVTAFIIYKFPLTLGLDLQGGTQLTLEAQDTKEIKADNDAVMGALAVIHNRIDGLGVAETTIRRKGLKQIVVELPGIKDPERATKVIGETALLEFVEAEWAPGDVSNLTPENLAILAGKNARLDKVTEYDKQGRITSERPIILKENSITGSYLKDAAPGTDSYGEPVVSIEFNGEGAKLFREMTTRSVGKPIAILLDGRIISAPNVNEPISGGRAQISGRFSLEEMRDLVVKLKAGALPVPITIVSTKVVGPTLGKDSIEMSKKAGLIAFVFIIFYMTLWYRIPGFVAGIVVLLYVAIILAILKLFGATLTLPGMAGIVITMGMAVDVNVIIFERIKEERKLGLSVRAAIDKGFSRGFVAVFDSHVTTLIAAVVLFWLGTGPIKGFGVTLTIGTLTNLFTAVTVTKLLLEGLSNLTFREKSIVFRVSSEGNSNAPT